MYIWLRQLWYFSRYPMRVFKWTPPQFAVTEDSAVIPVWFSTLLHLPVFLFNDEALASIANLVGKPIKMDMRRRRRSNLSAARLCVEVDVSKDRKDKIWIGFKDKNGIEKYGFWQHITYIREYPGLLFLL